MTPLQLNALAGLLNNQGFQANANMVSTIASYDTSPFIVNLLKTISLGAAVVPNVFPANTVLSANTITQLKTIGYNVCASLSDSFPANAKGYIVVGNTPAGLTGQITTNASTALPSDYTKFAQGFSAAAGFVVTNNQIILTNKNSQTYLGPVWSNMSNLMTGGVSSMNSNLQTFAADLRALGQLWNFAYLSFFGSPAEIIRQMQLIGGLTPSLITALNSENISETETSNLLVAEYQMADSLQAAVYRAMKKVTGNNLAQVLAILGVTTSNLTSMADLLDPVLLFPNSFKTLTVLIGNKTQQIYPDSGSGPAINSLLAVELPPSLIKSTSPGMPYERLLTIIPSNQALAFKALQQGFLQIKNIFEVTLPSLATSTSVLETTASLPLINNLANAVPRNVANTIQSRLPLGSGPSNTLVMGDVMGSLSGYNITTQLANVNQIIATINTSSLKSVYDTMANVVSGTYGNRDGTITIPPGRPGAGNYVGWDNAISTLCGLANTNIQSIASGNPSKAASLNQNWLTIANVVYDNINNFRLADIDYENISGNQFGALYSFVDGLHDIGVDVSPNGIQQFIINITAKGTYGGQAVLACLSEGRNLLTLSNSGVGTDTAIPDTY